jgi:hypothetical protein
MDNNSNTTDDESLFRDDFKMPLRSRLYHLLPIGIGTSEVESATSYLGRLAIAHCISTWMILKCEIAPSLFQAGANLRNRLSELVAAMGSAVNGESETSRKFIEILSAHTRRDDLEQTTMSFCHGFVGSRFLVRVKQTWCRSCLAERKASAQEIYYPLQWQLFPVKVCPRHRIKLETECPVCGHPFPPLTAHTRPGYCPRCNGWLGSPAKGTVRDEIASESDVGIAQRIADFLRDGPKKMDGITSFFAKNIALLLQSHFGGNIADLARYLEVNRYSVIAWKGGVHRPTLLTLANLSLKVNVPMINLLGTHLEVTDFSARPVGAQQSNRRLFASPPKTDLEKMRLVLEGALKGKMFPAPSLNKLAIQLKCNQSTIKRRFPELAEKIKAQYLRFHAIRMEVRSKLYRSIVRSVVMSIHKAGDYPSQWRVREALPEFIDMREPVAQQEWKEALSSLNYRTR